VKSVLINTGGFAGRILLPLSFFRTDNDNIHRKTPKLAIRYISANCCKGGRAFVCFVKCTVSWVWDFVFLHHIKYFFG